MITHSSHSSTLTRGYTLALISALILSTTAIFIRYLTQTYHIPALVLAFWRDVFVVLSLLPLLGVLRPGLLRLRRGDLVYLAAYGFVLAVFNAVWTLSVGLNGAAIATVLVYCSAAFTALLGWWLFKERLDWAKLLAVALCLAGCVLVSGALDATEWQANLLGVLTGVLAGLCYAVYTMLGRAAAQRGLNPWSTLIYIFAFATLFLFAVNLLPIPAGLGAGVSLDAFFWLKDAWVGWGVLFLLAAGPTLVGFGLYITSLTYLPSSVVNLIATLEPAFTAIIAYALLGERLNGIQVVGSFLILAGVVFLRIYEDGWAGKSQADLQSKIAVVSSE